MNTPRVIPFEISSPHCSTPRNFPGLSCSAEKMNDPFSRLSFSKVDHAVSILESLEQMWMEQLACDFVIKVGEELFAVHRALLVANSDYFKAMLASGMKEGKEGFIDMKGVEAAAIKSCLEYVYTGKTTLTFSNVVGILQAASILQLHKLENVCYEFFQKNLNQESCILTLETAQLYNQKDLENLSREFFTSYFSEVTISNSFCDLSKDDALCYILEFGISDDMKWRASKNWIERETEVREEELMEFFNMLDLDQFPSSFLMKDAWEADYFHKCDVCVSRLLQRIFSNVLEVSDNIDINNCFVLNEMAKSYEHTVQQIHSLIFTFMLEHFAKVTSMADFLKLPAKEVLDLLRSPHAVYFSSDKIKWNAALNWVRAKPQERKKVLKLLMKTIAFEKLPQDFVQESVRKEPLVQKFPDFQKLMLDAAFSKPQPEVAENCAAVLDSSNGLSVLAVGENKFHPMHFSASSVHTKITSLNGHLCVLNGKHLHILKNNKWWQMAALDEEPTASAKVFSLKDCIYVLEKETKMLKIYDASRDSWMMEYCFPAITFMDYILLPTKDALFILHSPLYTLAAATDLFKILHVPSTVIRIGENSSAAYCNGSIFVYGFQSETWSIAKYDLTSGTWMKINDSPHMKNGGRIKLATVDKRLVAYRTETMGKLYLEFYDDRLNDWIPLRNAPPFQSCGMPKSIISLCSFRNAKPKQ